MKDNRKPSKKAQHESALEWLHAIEKKVDSLSRTIGASLDCREKNNRAAALLNSGAHDEAAALLKECLLAAPGHAIFSSNLAEVLWQRRMALQVGMSLDAQWKHYCKQTEKLDVNVVDRTHALVGVENLARDLEWLAEFLRDEPIRPV
jgi:hypothetical protein